ncbi:response regulator transcription factor [Candidatus Falkowbacteria bacterium]|jgi:DNA-binding response OmpR family regulator|nr:response regulator transcription factor [Candidatus Falkowbacteria bacterium]
MSQKIFIVADDANILYGLESQFQMAGLEVEVSEADEEIDELISNIKEYDPDHIVLDLILPKIDGFEVVKRIKSDHELNEKEIFIFTDLSDEDSRSRSLELGADYVFFKEEFDTFEFAEKVINIITKKEGRDGIDENEDRDYEE